MAHPNDIQHGGDYYKRGITFQHWDLCATFNVGYLEGNATKYLIRWRKKNGLEDLRKAGHYIDKIAQMMKETEYKARTGVPIPIIRAFLQDYGITEHAEKTLIGTLFDEFSARDITGAQFMLKAIIKDASSSTS